MMDYFLATSNETKLREYHEYGIPFPGRKTEDISEPYIDILRVAAYKAWKAGPGAITEDTALYVEGANIGVLVRYLEHDLDRYEGRTALFQVALAANDGDKISVYYAETEGEIKKNLYPDAYGFDGHFVPDGAPCRESIYQLEKRGIKYKYSPRKKAVKRLLDNFPIITFENNFWEGIDVPLQEEVVSWINMSRNF